jgi:AraC family transcriptional regulator of adaptative response/methylated-DNA-[protein]-cysteine methyltransferase
MTFHQYQRRWRIAQAVEQIDAGNRIIDSAADAGYQSLSGFNQAFKNLLGESPGVASAKTRVSVEILQTPLGPMYAAATRQALCLLEFTDRKALARQIKRVQSHLNAFFIPGGNAATRQAAEQLKQYFASQREVFDLPLDLCGTDFQQRAWEALMRIPYASTRTYQQQAQAINRPAAIRAVASANAANPLAIVVPCHRVIGKNNTLAGYAGGIWRKRYLLELEAEKAGNRKP